MGDRVILHCDLNCFFASVELLSHPDLRDIPTAVCGDPASRHGIILAKNEPAKRLGIQTAETIWQAKKKCPGLVLLPPHHGLYREYSRYRPWWGGSSTRPGHFFLACQMVSAVWMPSRLAGSFLARMMPWREAGSPQTAVGMSRRSGWLSNSTEAKKQFRSQCKITRSPMAAHLLEVNHMFYYTTACAAAQEKNAVP